MQYVQMQDPRPVSTFVRRMFLIMLLTCFLVQPIAAQQIEAGESDPTDIVTENDEIDVDKELDTFDIDVQATIEGVEERRGFALDGDLRFGYIFTGDDFQDVTSLDTDILRARWRLRSIWGITEQLRGVFRVAAICSNENCSPDIILQPEIPTPASIEDGQITIDAAFLQWFRSDRFDVAVGRMETKFVARGGVFSKSLDRNDSNNLRVNWTDGLQTTFKAKNDWESHLILQYNSKDGPSNVRRDPLDFSSDQSRVSYFFGIENLQPRRLLIQRAIDVTYMPSSLRADGGTNGRVEDYWAIVARTAARWPVRSEGWRLRVSSELGYAPNTQEKFAAGLAGIGEVDGLAWNVTASIMDFLPTHSIGINFAKTEAGWLLSPQYSDNERLFEIRYMWRPNQRLSVDVRGRWRDDLRQRIVENPGRDRFDFYARFTWSFKLRAL